MKKNGEFQHTIPKFILQNFVKNQFYYICNKKTGKISCKKNIKNPTNPVEFGKKDFYGQENIADVTSEPTLAFNSNIRVEDYLDKIENLLAPIISTIIKDEKLILTAKQEKILKDYIYCQHVRTPATRRDIDSFKNTKEYLKFIEDAKKLGLSNKNIKEMDQKYSGKNQSALLVERKTSNHFNDITGISNKNIFLLSNKTKTPFVISDRAVSSDKQQDESYNFYLPISPKLCLFFTNQKSKNNEIIISEETVSDINECCWLAADVEIYSNDKNYLIKLYTVLKERPIQLDKDGTRTFKTDYK